MAQYKVGDKVRIARGTDSVEGIVRFDVGFHWVGSAATSAIEQLFTTGWRLEEVNGKAPEPEYVLPTEAGIYQDKDGDTWVVTEDDEYIYATNPEDITDPENYLPFVRLVLESEVPDATQIRNEFASKLRYALNEVREDLLVEKSTLPSDHQYGIDQQLRGFKRASAALASIDTRDLAQVYTDLYDGQKDAF